MNPKAVSVAIIGALTLLGCVGEEPLGTTGANDADVTANVNADPKSKNPKSQAAASNQKPKTPAKPAVSATKLDPGPQLEDPQLGAPKLGLALNGLKHAVVRAGRSVFIESVVRAGDGDDGVIKATLSKPGGAWADLVALDLQDSKGNSVPGLSFRALLPSEPSITLDEENSGTLVWELDLSAQALAPGEYRLRAVLDSSTVAGNGWKGKARSHISRLTVRPANAEMALDDVRSEVAAKVQILAFKGKDADAIRACDEFLANHPDDVLILEGKGDALFRLKRFQEAYQTFEKAISNVKPNTDPSAITEPPSILIHKSNLAFAELRKASK